MKMFLISDNVDTKIGMRLAGVEGVIVHNAVEVKAAINEVLKDREIGVLLITEKLGQLVPDKIKDVKLNYSLPLIVEIPDRHGTDREEDSITAYVREAIGLKI